MITTITDYTTGNVGGVQVPLPVPIPASWIPGLFSFGRVERANAWADAATIHHSGHLLADGVRVIQPVW